MALAAAALLLLGPACVDRQQRSAEPGAGRLLPQLTNHRSTIHRLPPLPPAPHALRRAAQVYLESVGTPEGDFLVSGVQAAVQRRMAAVWNELEEKKARGEQVKGACVLPLPLGCAVLRCCTHQSCWRLAGLPAACGAAPDAAHPPSPPPLPPQAAS